MRNGSFVRTADLGQQVDLARTANGRFGEAAAQG
jgi:hypothetical protein